MNTDTRTNLTTVSEAVMHFAPATVDLPKWNGRYTVAVNDTGAALSHLLNVVSKIMGNKDRTSDVTFEMKEDSYGLHVEVRASTRYSHYGDRVTFNN